MTRHEQAPCIVGDGEPTDEIPIASPKIGDAERARVDDVLASGGLAAGEQVDAFEAAFAAYCDVDRAVATANGTAALHAALEALGDDDVDRIAGTVADTREVTA